MSTMLCTSSVAPQGVRGLSSQLQHACCIEPLKDSRWDAFVGRHPQATVFHSSAWLQALTRTYGYRPVAYTTSPIGHDLQNAIVFCDIESWLTGRRLVSLPFSDHCEPLLDSEDCLRPLAAALEQDSEREGWRFIEIRPIKSFSLPTSLHHSRICYSFHELALTPDLETLFRNCHKGSIQRKIRRAERERLAYREGATEYLLECFYELFTLTRKRHSVPPPPRRWFVNLIECFGAALKIRVAFLDHQPVAAIITIRHKSTLVYKYGASDPRYRNLGSMHLLLWTSIREAKDCRLGSFDLGRSDLYQRGLAIFKSRWGAAQSTLSYSRYGISENLKHVLDLSSDWKSRAARLVMAHLRPDLLSSIGGALYRHVG